MVVMKRNEKRIQDEPWERMRTLTDALNRRRDEVSDLTRQLHDVTKTLTQRFPPLSLSLLLFAELCSLLLFFGPHSLSPPRSSIPWSVNIWVHDRALCGGAFHAELHSKSVALVRPQLYSQFDFLFWVSQCMQNADNLPHAERRNWKLSASRKTFRTEMQTSCSRKTRRQTVLGPDHKVRRHLGS